MRALRALIAFDANVAAVALTHRLYDAAKDEVDFDLVRQFVLDAEAADLFSESLTFEAKLKRNRNNVAEAVAALANTDGGLVLVGVAESDAEGEARLVGVPREELDRLVANLQNLLPGAMPEVIPVATPDNCLIIVLRVNADSVLHPVVVAGKVIHRVPGHTVPADRQRIIDLVRRDGLPGTSREGYPPTSVPGGLEPLSSVGGRPLHRSSSTGRRGASAAASTEAALAPHGRSRCGTRGPQ